MLFLFVVPSLEAEEKKSNYFINFIQTSTILYSEAPESLKLLIFEMKTPAICKLSNLIQDLSVNRILLTSTVSRGRA